LLRADGMEAMAERITAILRHERAALCVDCVADELRANPHVVHPSLSGLTLLDEFSYAVECSRCHRTNERTIIVGPHALDQTA